MKNLGYLSFIYRSRWLFLLPFTLLSNISYVVATVSEDKTAASTLQIKEAVVRLYEQKRYAKANAQIELLLPLLKNRQDRSTFEFYQAYCNFYEKKYVLSAHQFHLFVKYYSSNSNSKAQVEEACFMRGYSLASEDVDIRLDQTTTYDAMRCLNHYLDCYPAGAYLAKASDVLQSLQARLIQKSFQAAALYVRLGYYNAAIVALENFKQTYPDSSFEDKAVQLLLKCHEKLKKDRKK